MRERPFREKLKRIEEDSAVRERTVAQFSIPEGSHEFKEGYRECMSMYALHAPNKRGVAKILDGYCITLEDQCLRSMTREHVAQYEGYRQAIKDLRRAKKMR